MDEELNLNTILEVAEGRAGVKKAYKPLGINRGIDLEVDEILFDVVRTFVENLKLPQGYSRRYDDDSNIYIWKEPNLWARLRGSGLACVFSVAKGYSTKGSKGYKVDFIDLSDPEVSEIYKKTIKIGPLK